jgi:hypothetical protein
MEILQNSYRRCVPGRYRRVLGMWVFILAATCAALALMDHRANQHILPPAQPHHSELIVALHTQKPDARRQWWQETHVQIRHKHEETQAQLLHAQAAAMALKTVAAEKHQTAKANADLQDRPSSATEKAEEEEADGGEAELTNDNTPRAQKNPPKKPYGTPTDQTSRSVVGEEPAQVGKVSNEYEREDGQKQQEEQEEEDREEEEQKEEVTFSNIVADDKHSSEAKPVQQADHTHTMLPAPPPPPPPRRREGRIYVYKGLQDLYVASRGYLQAESKLLEVLRRQGHVTDDPGEAALFWIPHSLVAHWFKSPDASRQYRSLRSYWRTELRPFLERIYTTLPYFNASGGRNHVFVYTMDEGPICEVGHNNGMFSEDEVFKRIVHPMIHVGYYGILDRDAPTSRHSPSRRRCFDPARDVPIPQWNTYWKSDGHLQRDKVSLAARRCMESRATCSSWLEFLHRRADATPHDFFFRGQNLTGRHCSKGIRPWIQSFCANKENNCGGSSLANGSALFGLSPAGWGCWSLRYYDAVEHMTIPVRLADDIAEPFRREMPPEQYSVVVRTGNPANLPTDGGEQFRWMRGNASSWRAACGGSDLLLSDNAIIIDACLKHPISRKLLGVARARVAFNWDPNVQNGGGALRILMRELMRASSVKISLVGDLLGARERAHTSTPG